LYVFKQTAALLDEIRRLVVHASVVHDRSLPTALGSGI